MFNRLFHCKDCCQVTCIRTTHIDISYKKVKMISWHLNLFKKSWRTFSAIRSGKVWEIKLWQTCNKATTQFQPWMKSSLSFIRTLASVNVTRNTAGPSWMAASISEASRILFMIIFMEEGRYLLLNQPMLHTAR